MTTDLQTVQPGASQPPALAIRETVATIKARVQMVQHVMRDVMKQDVHYGKIPGTPKPTLYKPGAEIIALAFQFAPRYCIDDLSTDDAVRYRVTCELYSRETGAFIGSGQGEASSDEEKYRWRGAVCKAEFDVTPEDRRRVKFYKNGGTANQVRTEPADIANTVLKMGEKRAFVDAIRTASSCSDMFAQDLEDLPAEIRDEMADQEAPPVQVVGDDWGVLVKRCAAYGYAEADIIANAAAMGYEGAPKNMPRDLANTIHKTMRDNPVAPPDAGADDDAAEDAKEPPQRDESTPGDPEAMGQPTLHDAQRERAAKSPSELAAELAAKAKAQENAKVIRQRDVNMVFTQATIHGVDEADLVQWLTDEVGCASVEEIPQLRLDDVLDFIKSHTIEQGVAS